MKSKLALADYEPATFSHRLEILLGLTTGQRNQTIYHYIKSSNDNVILFVPEILKDTRPSHHLQPIELKAFKDIDLCLVAHLKQHIKMTAPSKNTDTNQLLMSFI